MLRTGRACTSPLHATAPVRRAGGGGGRVLRLAIDDTSWTGPKRQWTPLVPDHGHLMHLFLVRDATLAAFAHLHPLPLDSTTFETSLPPLEPGRYRAYADIVHESGFAETLVATVDLDERAGTWRPTDPDDAWTKENGKRETGNVVGLADGSTMIWDKSPAPILVDHDAPLHFVVTDPSGRPARLEPYMGMAGHATMPPADGAVVRHLPPAGAVSPPARETLALPAP